MICVQCGVHKERSIHTDNESEHPAICMTCLPTPVPWEPVIQCAWCHLLLSGHYQNHFLFDMHPTGSHGVCIFCSNAIREQHRILREERLLARKKPSVPSSHMLAQQEEVLV